MRTIITGLTDGYTQPYEFNVGMSYKSDFQQWVYDHVSIFGQRVARIRDAWAQPE